MIQVVSSEQSIRGIRHGSFRPQLIICDDLEDTQSVKTQESRDKLYDWFKNDLLPSREQGARVVVSGAVLHQDSLVMRLKKEIEEGKLQGIYRAYPILDEQGNSLWPGKYPDSVAIDKLKKEIGDDAAWGQEFLLVPSQRENAVIKFEWIHYYDLLPDITDKRNEFRFAITGIDLAISGKTSADCTAMVSAYVFGWGDKLRIYILPHPVNERLDFPKTLVEAKRLSVSLINGKKSRLVIESIGYQPALAQQLQKEGYPAEEFKVYGQDKEERLRITSPHVKQGTVLLPRKGAEILIQQVTNFGAERHDDLADAFAILINQIMAGNNKKPATPEILVL
jgi:predicted phage terminase large subunit-like protein